MSTTMSPKRKQPHDGSPTDASTQTSVKNLKLLFMSPPSPPHSEPAIDASPHTPIKKVKLVYKLSPPHMTPTDTFAHTPVKKLKVEPPPQVTPTGARKRKSPADEPTDNAAPLAPAKRLKPSPNKSAPGVTQSVSNRYNTPTTGNPKSTLVPRGERRTAKLCQKDDSVLRMVCDCSLTNTVKELHFRKIPHSMIDWNNVTHISKINAWRNQIYGRAGLKARSVSMWHEFEELWFELYFHLSIAESRKHSIMLPTTKTVRNAFNTTFVGKVLQDKDGDDLEVRAERQSNAFASKFSRVCPLLRARLNNCVFGKSGDVFVPRITFQMINKYKAMRTEMEANGIVAESVYSQHLSEWQHFLSHLPDTSNAEMRNFTEQEETKAMQVKEEDAAVALLSLANSPVACE